MAAASHVSGSIGLYNAHRATYRQIYRTQPNVRKCVEFLGRNLAHLGLHTFKRLSDTDRQRLGPKDHGLAAALARPNPFTTTYRLIEGTVQDLGIYNNAFWLKVRTPGRLGLVRLPADEMRIEGGLFPEAYFWTPPGQSEKGPFEPSEIVHFRGFDPSTTLQGLSPLETLRRVLAEQIAARDYRQGFWTNSARMSGVIERPSTARSWTPEQKRTFVSEWQTVFEGGANAGRTPVLEDGMTYKEMSYSAQESQLIESFKLGDEIVASAYHIPLPMVGILDHATFSNIKEQHKQLYQDTLGPWCEMLTQEMELQLLAPEWGDEDVYLDFNIAAKLAGTFEEQAAVIRTLTGRPIMTANEGRARLNLPKSTRPEDDQISDPTYIDTGQADTQRRIATPDPSQAA